jgi:hypothetical protein
MSLTLPEDRLPAIGGIAERFGILSENRYLAGLWQAHLPGGLLWIVDKYANNSYASYQPRPSTYLAPSWSWASTTQPISNHVFVGDSVKNGVSKVDVIRVDIRARGEGATYGKVIYGHLTLRGFITPVDWKLPRETDRYSDGTFTGGYSIAVCRDAEETSLLAEGANTIRAYLLVLVANKAITRVTGLILRQHSDRAYMRMGVFDIPGCPADEEKYPNMARGLLQGNAEEVTII